MKQLKICPKYKPLFTDHGCRFVLITGGRASGKSFVLSLYLRTLMSQIESAQILFSRYTMTSALDSIIKEFEEKVELLNQEDFTTKTGRSFKDTNTGTEIVFKGLKTSSGNQTAALKSFHELSCFVLDEAEELVDEDTFDKIQFSIRTKKNKNTIILCLNPTHTEHWIYQKFFKDAGVDPEFNGIHDDTVYINTNYLDNIENLDESYLKEIEKTKQNNFIKFLHRFMGKWQSSSENALWDQKMVQSSKNAYDPDKIPIKIAVGVDPSVSNTGKQDECGLVVAAKYDDDDYVILEDATAVLSPAEWGKKAYQLYKKWDADAIIVETNNGGDLCVDNIVNCIPLNKRKTIKILKVRASKGKLTRAEPISTLYENGCVAHAPGLDDLEIEITTYDGDPKKKSPGRLDAMVWVMTWLSQCGLNTCAWAI